MHPALAVWIWMMAMARAWQGSAVDFLALDNNANPENESAGPAIGAQPRFVLANGYLHSDVPESPLPERLLDRLAELYWTERDSEMAI